MSGFAADWLALRHPLDLAARNQAVEAAFLDILPAGPVRLMDLASGTGATVRALQGKLDRPVDWLLTDYDPALLELAEERLKGIAQAEISSERIDLSADLETLPFPKVDAVTTSAFLDLVSESFLDRLVEQVVSAGKPFLASLTYDGRAEFTPQHPFDATLTNALNAHQQTDKGFGPALGPNAAQKAIELFEARGYRVVVGTSDWKIAPSASSFLSEFLSGWKRVGRECNVDPLQLEAWWLDRVRSIGTEQLSMTVGHIDFLACP
ncbi:class I SAM-dependent methyltransferase [Roseibium sp. M-1]